MTKQRRLILEILRNSHSHLTAEQVFERAKVAMPGIVRATIYNNLNALTLSRTIKRVKVFDGADSFDANTAPHDHLTCEVCGKLQDVILPNIKQTLEKKTGLHITDYELNLHYVCDECQKRNK